jgi:AraC-like DNA-binding protein
VIQHFVSGKRRGRLELEQPAELMYLCLANAGDTRLPRAMHRHDDRVEIVFIREGSGTHIIDGRAYSTGRGDLLIYNGGVLHDESANPGEGMNVYCCAFTNLKLRGLPKNTLSRGRVRIPTGERHGEFDSLFGLLHAQIRSEQRLSLACCDHLLQALLLMVSSLIDEQDAEETAARYELGESVKRYIDRHYQDELDLGRLSEALNISPYYLAHRFRQSVGCSPIQYLIRRRIGEAQTLLINTGLSVTDIALMVGYDNPNYFNTAFRKVVGIPPGRYRRQYLE